MIFFLKTKMAAMQTLFTVIGTKKYAKPIRIPNF